METAFLLLPLFLPLIGVPITLFLRKQRRMQSITALALMLISLGFSFGLLRTVQTTLEPVQFQLGLWQAPFGITLAADLLSVFMLIMTQIVLCAGLVYALGSTEKVVQYPTFYPLFLALSGGLSGAFITGDIFNLFVFAEIIVISGAALTAIAATLPRSLPPRVSNPRRKTPSILPPVTASTLKAIQRMPSCAAKNAARAASARPNATTLARDAQR